MEPFPSTQYFHHTRVRPDRVGIKDEWILQTIRNPETEEIQTDGRIRQWARIPDFENQALRVILLEDGRNRT